MRGTADLTLAAVAVSVLIADQATKFWAQAALDDGPIDVVWTLRFYLVGNTGMSFSRGSDLGPFLGLAIVAIVVALVVFRSRIRPGWPLFAYGCILGGAMGNLADRVFRGEGWLRGAVVDFIDFQWWPVFNIADMGIVCGGVAMVLISWFDARHDDGAGTPPIDGSDVGSAEQATE
ncbi:MAG: signal peptidase II [Actinomycetia bacterium]|nr:signal peptidase II [Actinomycetes bacterium]MCP4957662.1 signal peptidase II [Actinomycetes bacterium]